MTPAQLLVTARRRRGLTQAALARRAGTSQPVISAYEHGRRDPTTATLRRLMAAAGERLELRLGADLPELPPPSSLREHGDRLLSVLSLVDAVPAPAPVPDVASPAAGLDRVTGLPLADKVRAVDAALAAVPHAFGGALALAYWAEPRATIDIDVNVFVPADRADEVLAPLGGLGVDTDDAATVIRRDGQARVMWDGTPIDLFFAYDPFHDAAAAASVEVPFADTMIRVLSADHLAVCKAIFDRGKDWVDIETMLELGTHLDTAEVLRWVGRIAGDQDPRYERIAALLTVAR